MNPTRLGFSDRLRIELALLRIDWVLDGRLPWRARARLKGELRANLLAATESLGNPDCNPATGRPRSARLLLS